MSLPNTLKGADLLTNPRDKHSVRNGKTNVRNDETVINIEDFNEKGNCKTNVRPYSSISSSYSITNNLKDGGGGKPPPAAVPVELKQNRQWIELTDEEKKMSKVEFVNHLQKLYPSKNVREVGKKLKEWCKEKGKDFKLERLKGWLAGEGVDMTEEEFLSAFGNDEPEWKRAIDACNLCDENGYRQTENGVEICKHEGEK